jgi:hypothetical protein
MHHARFNRTLVMCLVLGLASVGQGCGSGRVSPEEAKAAAKVIQADNQNFYKEMKTKKPGSGKNVRGAKGRGPG